jgi:hypothetical protein
MYNEETTEHGLTFDVMKNIMRLNAEVCATQVEEAIAIGDEQEQHYARGSRDAYLFALRILTNDQEGYLE